MMENMLLLTLFICLIAMSAIVITGCMDIAGVI